MARLAYSTSAPDPATGKAPVGLVAQCVRRTRAYDLVSSVLQPVISALALAALSPLFAVIALLIKLSSPGPIFYRGERVGKHFRRFTIYKFRTMLPGTEAQIGSRLLRREEQYRFCTPVGRMLKRAKVDEIPQLINVLKGQMRLVGPRPVRPVFLERLVAEVPGYGLRFLVPPGITGIAQLRGGYYTAPRDKLRYDLAYIRHRSLLLDLRLVVLTFVKILNRWLSMGLFVLFLFLFASFVPVELQPALRIPSLGLHVGVVALLVITVSAWVFVKVGPAQFSLYRCPINLPLLLFLILCVVSTARAADPALALRGSVYYVATGFLTTFIIVNTLATTAFITCTVRVIALTSAVVSLLGLFEVFAGNNALGPAAAGSVRVTSVLGSPVELAVYLVLGMPLLLAEMTSARTVRDRDFWLVCATISFVGVFLTQTRVGLLALLVSGVLFLYRRRASVLAFVTVFLLAVLLLASLGLPRFSGPVILDQLSRRIEENAVVFYRPPLHWLIGSGAASTAEILGQHQPPLVQRAAGPHRPAPTNMHLTLIAEFGILGWLVVMWLVAVTIAAMKQAHDRTRDERLKTMLWAILSSLGGYVISMASMNTFHQLPIQVFFWSLIGIGLALATRGERRRRRSLIWHFGDAGD